LELVAYEENDADVSKFFPPMSEHISINIGRNIARTRVVVIVAFCVNALANVLLIGFFARRGGLELVGAWAFLNAIILNTLILDLGFTNALTYKIGRDGVLAALPMIYRLLRWAGIVLLAIILAMIVVAILGLPIGPGVGFACVAADMQLAANWLCAIRMGRHEQYWYNVQTVVRVIVQSFSAAGLVIWFPNNPEPALGAAFLLGSMCAFWLSFYLVRGDLYMGTGVASLSQVRQVIVGFGLENAMQRAFLPLSQLTVAHFLGATALGVFTIALRIPFVLNQSVSEALRGLLPGIAGALRDGDSVGVVRLLREATITQIVLIVPTMTFFIIHTPILLSIWIGQGSGETVFAIRMLCTALAFVTVATPFYWTLQASGNVHLLGFLGSVRLIAALSLGATVMFFGGGIIGFVAVFALVQTADALLTILIVEIKFGFFTKSIHNLLKVRLAVYLIAAVVLNLLAKHWFETGFSSGFQVVSLITLNVFLIGCPGLLALRRGNFIS